MKLIYPPGTTSLHNAALKLGISRHWIAIWVRKQMVPCYSLGDNKWAVKVDELREIPFVMEKANYRIDAPVVPRRPRVEPIRIRTKPDSIEPLYARGAR